MILTRLSTALVVAIVLAGAVSGVPAQQRPPAPKRISPRFVAPGAKDAQPSTDNPAEDAPQKAKVDPKAKQALDAFGNYMRKLKSFQVVVASRVESKILGKNIDVKLTQNIRFERPNKLYIDLESNQPNSGAKIVSDGKELMLYLAAVKKYVVDPAPATIQELLENPLLVGLTNAGNAGVVTTAMFSDDPVTTLLENVESVSYVALEDADGTKLHHLKANTQTFDWDLYIDAGKQPLVRKFVPDLTELAKQLSERNGEQGEPIKIDNEITFENWDTAPKFVADAFALTAPEGAEKVASIQQMFGRPSDSAPSSEPDAQTLVGQPAPPFEAPILDGAEFKLADQANKNVVVLDFWATWCGPCRRAMPIISKVTKEFQDKGVIFYAVNIDEDADTIKQFLQDEKLDVPVLLDGKGQIAKKFLVTGIPQTVLVGKDGRVQVVHVGIGPNLEEQLTGELESLVAGKDLAADKHPAN